MTKRERVAAALRRQPVDRPPVSFWRHVPDVDHTAAGLADAMLAWQRRWDLDFVKVMSSGVYCVEDWGCTVAYAGSPNGAKQCVEHAVRTAGDWARIKVLDPGAGALGRELEALGRIVRGRGDDAPVLHTLFSPLTIARKLAGERLAEDLRTSPEAVGQALEAITETMIRYGAAAIEAGADGVFFATQMASPDVMSRDVQARFGLPYARRVLGSLGTRSSFTLLHVHGKEIYFDDLAGALAVHAVNWHDRLTPPALGEAQRRFAGAVVGGLSEGATLRRGPAASIVAEVEDAIRQTAGRGVMVAPGCVLPLDTPDAHLEAVVSAVRTRRR
jgi:uroporphyrinogen decarboxylase